MGSFFYRCCAYWRVTVRSRAAARGFTLVEMLVVLAIIVVISAVAFTSQTMFNRTLTLTNTAYNVALSIRQAENYGIASRIFGSVKNAGYGVHFDALVTDRYYFFADIYPLAGDSNNCHCNNAVCAALPDAKPGNCVYDAGASELFSQYTFGSGISVADLCGIDSSTGVKHCAVASPADLSALDVVFVRPNTQVTLTGTLSGSGVQRQLSSVTVYLGASGVQRCVTVNTVGQVSVPLTCP